MGQAKRRKDLGLPTRVKEFVLPEFNKEDIKQKVRKTLYKYPNYSLYILWLCYYYSFFWRIQCY